MTIANLNESIDTHIYMLFSSISCPLSEEEHKKGTKDVRLKILYEGTRRVHPKIIRCIYNTFNINSIWKLPHSIGKNAITRFEYLYSFQIGNCERFTKLTARKFEIRMQNEKFAYIQVNLNVSVYCIRRRKKRMCRLKHIFKIPPPRTFDIKKADILSASTMEFSQLKIVFCIPISSRKPRLFAEPRTSFFFSILTPRESTATFLFAWKSAVEQFYNYEPERRSNNDSVNFVT